MVPTGSEKPLTPFGARINARLESQGRRVTWLVAQVGIPRTSLYRKLRGESPISREEARRIATAVGFDYAMLEAELAAEESSAHDEPRSASRVSESAHDWMTFRPAEPSGEGGLPLRGRQRLPLHARAIVEGYLSRMRDAGVSDAQIDEAERIMVESNFSKLNKRDPRPRTEDELIVDIDAAWAAISTALRAEGFRV